MAVESRGEVERLSHVVAAVLQCLKDAFPHDFHRRCAFSARGIRELLAREGIASHAVGGRFIALAVGRSDARYALQGFQWGPEPYPHLWVETEHRLIDLGPHLLPFGSPFPLVPMPALAWDKSDPLPAALAYEPIDVIADDAPFSYTGEVAEEADHFVACCLTAATAPASVPPLPWLLTGMRTLDSADIAGKPWAQAAKRFTSLRLKA